MDDITVDLDGGDYVSPREEREVGVGPKLRTPTHSVLREPIKVLGSSQHDDSASFVPDLKLLIRADVRRTASMLADSTSPNPEGSNIPNVNSEILIREQKQQQSEQYLQQPNLQPLTDDSIQDYFADNSTVSHSVAAILWPRKKLMKLGISILLSYPVHSRLFLLLPPESRHLFFCRVPLLRPLP